MKGHNQEQAIGLSFGQRDEQEGCQQADDQPFE